MHAHVRNIKREAYPSVVGKVHVRCAITTRARTHVTNVADPAKGRGEIDAERPQLEGKDRKWRG